MKTKNVVSMVVGACIWAASIAAHACNACAGWGSSWGKRMAVCVSPSEGELNDLVGCMRASCASACDGYLSSYDACASTNDPACSVTDTGQPDQDGFTPCDYCLEGAGPYQGLGCKTEATACSYDLTGCVPCTQWLGGGDPDNLCNQAPPAANSIDDAIAVSDCVCQNCAGCASACAAGYFQPSLASFSCGICLGTTCSASYGACSAN